MPKFFYNATVTTDRGYSATFTSTSLCAVRKWPTSKARQPGAAKRSGLSQRQHFAHWPAPGAGWRGTGTIRGACGTGPTRPRARGVDFQ